MYTEFWWGNPREGQHLEDPGVDGRIILKLISRIGMEGMDWIDLAEYRNKWRAVVNVVMNFRVP
jgi:hypothetical protein